MKTRTRTSISLLFVLAATATTLLALPHARDSRVSREKFGRKGIQPHSVSGVSWYQLSPTGTGPDENSQQFISDGQGSLIMFGGCGSSGCNTSQSTFVLRDAFGVFGNTHWTQLPTSGGPPSARHAHLLAYDSILNELIVSGGCVQ